MDQANNTDGMRDWRNEHGEPDFAYLQSLQTDGGPEAIEKLRSIAEDMDVEFDSDTPPEKLMDLIRSSAARNEDGQSIVTN
jgi:hypothetical protein